MPLRLLNRRRIIAPCFLLAGLLTACEGPNRFSGPGRVDARESGGRAPTVEIQAPRGDSLSALPLGDSVLVRVRVRDDAGVDSVRMSGVALRGDPALGTQRVVTRFTPKTIILPSPRDTVLTRHLIATADTTREVVSIVVQAFDSEGQVSSDTTRLLLGGPSVDLLNLTDNQAVQAGLSLSLQLRASDPNGITTVEFRISGAFADTLRRSFNPALDSVRVDTSVVIPAGTTGEIQVVAVARNSVEISGQDGPVRLRIVAPGAQDVTRPSLAMTISSPDRLEAQDSVRVRITGQDDPTGGGIARAGVSVRAVAPGRGVVETRVFTRDFAPARTGTVTETLAFAPFNINASLLPDTLVFEVTAFLVDASGNCAAAVTPGVTQSLPCVTDAPSGAVTAASGTPFRLTRAVVAGRTISLPSGGRIMDAAVDVPRTDLLLSNITQDRIEVFDLTSQRFTGFVPVGSEPWGLELDRTGDTLIVANSGGTNISKVRLGGSPAEVDSARFLTPPVRFFDVERKLDQTGALRYLVSYICPLPLPPVPGSCFSDRPQFLVQDFTGRLLYSTKRTALGFFGTIRKAFTPPGAIRPEVVMFWEHSRVLPTEDFTAIANVDSISIVGSTVSSQEVVIWDHVPGDTIVIMAGPAPTPDSAVVLARLLGSDAVAVPNARFSVQNMGFSDTTFVARSGDRKHAVFGEGTVQFGRIIMYDAGLDYPSVVIDVHDLMRNASERVRGMGLNYDGTLGVARGLQAYFFSEDLRLQGVADLPAGGAGATLHPLHANARSLRHPSGRYNPNTHIAFLGTGERTIDIVDTFHFFRSGRIFIRDIVSGPLRAVLPFPADNAGRQCQSTTITARDGTPIGEAIEIFANGDFNTPHPPNGLTEDLCIVLKLFGVTDTGGVVVVDVRKSDILRNHPARR